jgi:hypothetical protein
MMTLNALLVAWNLSAKIPQLNRPVLKRHEFFWYVAQCMLDYKEEHLATPATTTAVSSTNTRRSCTETNNKPNDHIPIPMHDGNAKCAVCKLDYNVAWQVALDSIDDNETRKETMRQSAKNILTQLSTCSKCRITSHPTIPQKRRHIHSIPSFQGKTCFEISHTTMGYEVWRRNNSSKVGRAYNPQMKHPICQQLRELHGLQPSQARKRKCRTIDNHNSDKEDDD